MIARCNFWHNAAEFLVLGNLGRNLATQQFAVAKNGDRRFIARGFERQYCHGTILAAVVSTAELKQKALGTSASTAIS